MPTGKEVGSHLFPIWSIDKSLECSESEMSLVSFPSVLELEYHKVYLPRVRTRALVGAWSCAGLLTAWGWLFWDSSCLQPLLTSKRQLFSTMACSGLRAGSTVPPKGFFSENLVQMPSNTWKSSSFYPRLIKVEFWKPGLRLYILHSGCLTIKRNVKHEKFLSRDFKKKLRLVNNI